MKDAIKDLMAKMSQDENGTKIKFEDPDKEKWIVDLAKLIEDRCKFEPESAYELAQNMIEYYEEDPEVSVEEALSEEMTYWVD